MTLSLSLSCILLQNSEQHDGFESESFHSAGSNGLLCACVRTYVRKLNLDYNITTSMEYSSIEDYLKDFGQMMGPDDPGLAFIWNDDSLDQFIGMYGRVPVPTTASEMSYALCRYYVFK